MRSAECGLRQGEAPVGERRRKMQPVAGMTLRATALGCAAAMLVGCASGSALVTGTRRPPTDPSQVRVYTSPPSSYEVIGIVRASSNAGWNQQRSLDYALAELRKQTAKIGANGILLRDVGEKSDSFSATYVPLPSGGGVLAGGRSSKQSLSGEAIYVSQ